MCPKRIIMCSGITHRHRHTHTHTHTRIGTDTHTHTHTRREAHEANIFGQELFCFACFVIDDSL